MKISKIIFLLILSHSLFNSSIAMEPDSGDENSSNEDALSMGDTKSDSNAEQGFKFFTKLPPELQYHVLCLDLASIYRGNPIRRRAIILSLVCKLIRDFIIMADTENIWQKILEAEAYVQGKKSCEIVQELINAAAENNIQHVRFLILGGADRAKNDGSTSLIWPITDPRSEIQNSRMAIFNVKVKVNDGDTALSWAVNDDRKATMSILIAADADLNAKNYWGNTPLICAIEKGNTEIVNLLITSGVDLNAKNNDGCTPLICAIEKDNTEMVNLLINAGADLNAKDIFGDTPLIAAAINGRIEIVKILIVVDTGLVNGINSYGNTALMLASRLGNTEIVNLLIASGADLNAKNNKGYTALSWATNDNHIKMVNILIAAGVNLNQKNNKGDTALNLATYKGYEEIVELLQPAESN